MEFVSISHILRQAPAQYVKAYLHSETNNDTTFFLLHQLGVDAHQRSHAIVYQTARADLPGLESLGLLDKAKQGQAFVFYAPDDRHSASNNSGKAHNAALQAALALPCSHACKPRPDCLAARCLNLLPASAPPRCPGA